MNILSIYLDEITKLKIEKNDSEERCLQLDVALSKLKVRDEINDLKMAQKNIEI